MYHYRLYGLNMANTVEVHGLARIAPVRNPDIYVEDQATPPGVPLNGAHWVSDEARLAYTDDAPADFRAMPLRWTADGAYLQWRMMRYIAMIFSQDGRRVYTRWSPSVSSAVRAFNLVTAGMGMILRLRRMTALHASVIRIGDGAVAFAGNSGVGKSTLAAFFEQMGMEVMSDDLCVLDERAQPGQFMIPAGVPRIRLMHDAAAALYGNNRTLQPTPDGEKLERDLHWHDAGDVRGGYAPLKAVYVIAGRGEQMNITSIEPMPAVLAVSRHIYLRYIADAESRARDLSTASAVVTRIPIYQMIIPHGFEHMNQLCRALAARHS